MENLIEDVPIRKQFKDGTVLISNVRNPYTNLLTSYLVVNVWHDGSIMEDSKVDIWGVYTKYKSTGEYLRENLPNWGDNFFEVDTVQGLRELEPYIIHLVAIGYYKGIRLNGYWNKKDTPAPIEYYKSNTLKPDNGGSIFIIGDIKLERTFVDIVRGEYFGISYLNDNNDVYINNAVDYVKENKPMTLIFPKGILNYSSIQNLGINSDGVTYSGYAANKTVLKFNGGGPESIAININSFLGGNSNTPFGKNITFQDLNILMSNSTEEGLHIEGVARCIFKNVRINGGNRSSSIGIVNGAQLTHFYNLRCSYVDGDTPYLGMRTIASVRDGMSSNCSDNTFYDIQLEGCVIGAQLTRTDQNTFIGGTIEKCDQRGLSISFIGGGRYNTFIGVGFENKDADFDVIDSGTHTTFMGCYAIRLNLQGRMSKVMSGYFDLIQINSGAADNILENVTYSHWRKEGYAFGLIDNGQRTLKLNTAKATGTYDVNGKEIVIKDKNFGLFDGSVVADSFRNRILDPNKGQDYKPNLVNADSFGGFVPFQNTSSIDSIINTSGSGFKVQRRGILDPASDIGSWALWTSVNDDLNLKLMKLNSVGVWKGVDLIHNLNLATVSSKGIVNQTTAISDISNGPATNLEEALVLLNEIRQKFNAKLQADRVSGQQGGLII